VDIDSLKTAKGTKLTWSETDTDYIKLEFGVGVNLPSFFVEGSLKGRIVKEEIF